MARASVLAQALASFARSGARCSSVTYRCRILGAYNHRLAEPRSLVTQHAERENALWQLCRGQLNALRL